MARPGTPRTARQRAARARGLNALARARRTGQSVTRAARDEGTTVGTIRRYLGGAISRPEGSRRYRVRPGDSYSQSMRLVGSSGPDDWEVRGSVNRRRAAAYLRDVEAFRDGKAGPEVVERWRGTVISGFEVEADPDALTQLANRGELDPDELAPYPETAR
jgi:hypothetical protein